MAVVIWPETLAYSSVLSNPVRTMGCGSFLSDKMSHIIADAYKSRRPAGQGVQKGRNLPVIGEDIQAAGQAVFRANGKLISVHALTIAEIALLIRLRVADVADKTDFLMAVLNQEYYRNRPVTL